MPEESDNLTNRWLVTIVLSVLGALLSTWMAWITHDHLRISEEIARRSTQIEQIKRLEERVESLADTVARAVWRTDSRGIRN